MNPHGHKARGILSPRGHYYLLPRGSTQLPRDFIMPKLTKRFIDSLSPDPKRDVWAWDSEMPGLGIRVKPSGRKSYLVQYRSEGRTRRCTIGPHGSLTPAAARRQAKVLLANVAQGGNPSQKRKEKLKASTIAELGRRYLSEHAAVKKKASSYKRDKRLIERFINPHLGSHKINALTRADVARVHNTIGQDTPIQANRTLAVLSKMLTLAIQWGLMQGDNPCKHIERFKERKREHYLSTKEIGRLGAALSKTEKNSRTSPYAIAAIRFLLLSGARVGEIVSLKWAWVSFERSCLDLPDSKTGKKIIPLAASAIELLATLPRIAGNPHVFPGTKFGKPIGDIKGAWERVRDLAGLPGTRLHDLRHSWASQAAAAGLSLPIIGAVLGHTEPATTARYSHLANDPLIAAANLVGDKITEALSKEPTEKVVKLGERREK